MSELLNLPAELPFSTSLPVRITDINYGNHVGNDAVLGMLHEARVQFLAHHGFSEIDCGGVALIMRDVIIEYKAQMNYGEVVDISVGAVRAGRAGFNVFFRAMVGERVTVEARTGMVFFDYERQRPARMPEAFKPVLSE